MVESDAEDPRNAPDHRAHLYDREDRRDPHGIAQPIDHGCFGLAGVS
jgi:hypothetical protein